MWIEEFLGTAALGGNSLEIASICVVSFIYAEAQF